MLTKNKYFIFLKLNLYAVPVFLGALILWAVIGSMYIAIAPPDLSGPGNIGIVLSTFGLCLFVADRLAYLWLRIQCRLLFFSTWMWGVAFIIWGLLEWLHSISRQYMSFFVIHWTMSSVIISIIILIIGRCRQKAE